jgi:hypothetical protein
MSYAPSPETIVQTFNTFTYCSKSFAIGFYISGQRESFYTALALLV